jgi:hypothetical protein
MAQLKITGNTYPVKDALKAIGARWDADERSWTIASSKIDQARKIVADAPKSQATPGKCLACGKQLATWERQRSVKRCADCRDGGGNARGGQSYYHRGEFILGDDD